ncbi:MAG: hypothetical protein WCH35_14970 [Comamonadaceae bacterium]
MLQIAASLVSLVACYLRRERLRKAQITTMAMIGIANSKNSNDPEPPSGETPNIFSMKSMLPPDIQNFWLVTLTVATQLYTRRQF